MKKFYVNSIKTGRDEDICQDTLSLHGTDGSGNDATIQFNVSNGTVFTLGSIAYSLLDTELVFPENYHDDSMLGLFATFYKTVSDFCQYDEADNEEEEILYTAEEMFDRLYESAVNKCGAYVFTTDRVSRCDFSEGDRRISYRELPEEAPSDVLVAMSLVDERVVNSLWRKVVDGFCGEIRKHQMSNEEYIEEIYSNPVYQAKSEKIIKGMNDYIRSEYAAKNRQKARYNEWLTSLKY